MVNRHFVALKRMKDAAGMTVEIASEAEGTTMSSEELKQRFPTLTIAVGAK